MAILMTIVSCFIFCFSCFTITPSTCSSNETDLLALLAFKAAIVADPHGVLNPWNETTHHCKWNGIFCEYIQNRDRVVEINLRSQGFVGSLSPHIGNLSFLRRIALKNNSFYGQIPQEIVFLRKLEFVEFSNNSFFGSIPRNLSQCPNLFYLNLIDNNLSGSIPPELGSLYKLKALGLSKNKLQGHIPPFFGNLTSLIQLSLAYCNLKGEIPESLSQLQNLKFLQLSKNFLVGAIPSGLFNISTLETIGVSNNTLEGTIPASIGLYLDENLFNGKLPLSLSNATTLQRIILQSNYFTGPMPKELGKLTALQAFIITYNLIQDDISFITSLENCTQLQYISVGINPLTGSLPESISNLSRNLKSLQIYSTEVHGNIPLGIENLGTSLIFLSLEDNFLEGPIPFGLHKLFNLENLYLKSNRFTNEIPSSLGNLTLLNNLDLSGNNFYGSIPSSLSNCTKLISLSLSHNSLNGSIPQDIMSLSSFSVFLDLSHNFFTGSIPSEVGLLKNLGSLDFSNNRLSGLIPGSLGRCMSLQWLHLEGNSLQGEIPSGLSSLKGLQNLDLSRNNLSGRIPMFLGNLNLEYLNLSFNMLQGEVPTRGLFRNRAMISVDGNGELCGGIFELSLPPCPSSVSSSKKRSSKLSKILIPTLSCGGTFLTLSVCFIIYIYMRKMNKKDPSSFVPSYGGPEFLRLSYSDLVKATGGFSEANLLGSGRFGSVYKGILHYGNTLVAVKVLNLYTKGASKSFMAECNVLKGIRHRNLLKIISICESIDFHENDFKALVYEFHANGSLEKWLYHNNRGQEGEPGAESKTLNMIQRLKIAIDIACGLEYLHFGTDSTIVHGDLKPDNILLDHDMNAHIGDFGLSKIISNMIPENDQNSYSSIGVKGTLGYLAPEYGTSDLISTEGDVYSYGILLLEMFTNKRPTDDAFKDNINLHNYVSTVLQAGCVMDIVDPLLLIGHGRTSKINHCLTSILSIGVSCSREAIKDRMLMNDVVRELQKIKVNYLAEE